MAGARKEVIGLYNKKRKPRDFDDEVANMAFAAWLKHVNGLTAEGWHFVGIGGSANDRNESAMLARGDARREVWTEPIQHGTYRSIALYDGGELVAEYSYAEAVDRIVESREPSLSLMSADAVDRLLGLRHGTTKRGAAQGLWSSYDVPGRRYPKYDPAEVRMGMRGTS